MTQDEHKVLWTLKKEKMLRKLVTHTQIFFSYVTLVDFSLARISKVFKWYKQYLKEISIYKHIHDLTLKINTSKDHITELAAFQFLALYDLWYPPKTFLAIQPHLVNTSSDELIMQPTVLRFKTLVQ